MIDYTYESSYDSYLLEILDQQNKINRYISECIIIAEGKDVFGGIKALNEGIGDTISEWWDKLKSFLRRIWGKFVENFAKIANTNKGYVERYRDIILKKPIPEEFFPISMRDMVKGIARIDHNKMPMFSPNLLSSINLQDGDKNVAIKKKFLSEYNPEEEFVSFAKDYFIGSKEDIKFSDKHSINMTDIYNYIVSYDKIKSNLESDYNSLDKAIDSITNNLKTEKSNAWSGKNKKTSSGESKVDETKGEESKDKGIPEKTDVKEFFMFKNDSTYSVVYEQYITEMETNNNKGNASGTGDSTPAPNNQMKNVGANNIDKAHDTSLPNERKAQLKSEDDATLEKKSQIYAGIARSFLTAKMTAAEFIAKEYMSLVKQHVQFYVGATDKAKDQSVRSAEFTPEEIGDIDPKELPDALEAIKNVEGMKEGPKKEQGKRAVVATLRSFNSKFTGDYEDAVKYLKAQQQKQTQGNNK